MTKTDLLDLLRLCIHLEHNDDSLSKDDYLLISRLAHEADAPQFIADHFNRIATSMTDET